MQATNLHNLTVEEYLALEKANDTKYEYHDGSIYAMAGGTINHGLISGNIFGELRTGLKNKNRTAINSEIKLHVEAKNRFLYPDAMVICGKIETSEKEKNAVTNPSVIIEVLSESTASYDRGDKFHIYRQIESLQEYILIEQNAAKIDVYKRQGDLWQISRVTGLEAQLYIEALDLEVDLRQIYASVEF